MSRIGWRVAMCGLCAGVVITIAAVLAGGEPPSSDAGALAAGATATPTQTATSAQSAPSRRSTIDEPVQDAIEARDFHEAFRLLGGTSLEASDPTRLVRGHVALQIGEAQRAAEDLRAVQGAVPELEDYRLHDLAQAALAIGNAQEAGQAASKLEQMAGSRFAPAATLLRARALQAAGRNVEAAEVLSKLLASPVPSVDRPLARMTLASALEAAGDPAGAARAYRVVAVHAASHRLAAQALEALLRLNPSQPLTAAERLQRAEELNDNRMHEEAIRELEQVRPPHAAVRATRVKWVRAMALYRMRGHYEESAALLAEIARSGGPESEEAAFLWARALLRAHRDAEALKGVKRFIKRYPQSDKREKAQLIGAQIELGLGRVRAATKKLQVLAATTKNADIRLEARWQIGWAELEGGRARAAIAGLDRYAAEATGSTERARGAYWAGVACLRAKREADGRTRLRRLVKDSPLHYYGLLARQRLLDQGVEVGPPFGERVLPDPEPGIDETLRERLLTLAPPAAEKLLALGMQREAVTEIGRHKAKLGRQDLLQMYRLAHATERLYHLAVDTMGATLSRPPVGEARLAWALAYPRPYGRTVEEHSRARGLSAELIYAIMRQESSFDPDVVSYANAVGLLQMLPQTARRVAEQHGEEFDEECLMRAECNLRLGAIYIGGLSARYKGQLPLVLAAYNGGPRNVDRWLASFGDRPTDEFVERIPFDQTRNYVRRVLSAYARYRFLYDGTGEWPLVLAMQIDRQLGPGPDY